jgi:hypothetical protein
MLLPGTQVQVMDATDAQFQESIASQVGIPEDATGWSFDDRCRLVNYCRQHLGLDVFAVKTIPNNSESIPAAELFEPDGRSYEAGLQPVDVKVSE